MEESIFDILNRLSPDEIVVLVYHKVLKVNLEEIPGHRWRFKTTCLDTNRCLNRINAKKRKEYDHENKIAAFQELFTNDVSSLF